MLFSGTEIFRKHYCQLTTQFYQEKKGRGLVNKIIRFENKKYTQI